MKPILIFYFEYHKTINIIEKLFWNICSSSYCDTLRQLQPLNKSHLVAVRGLIHQDVSTKECQKGELYRGPSLPIKKNKNIIQKKNSQIIMAHECQIWLKNFFIQKKNKTQNYHGPWVSSVILVTRLYI